MQFEVSQESTFNEMVLANEPEIDKQNLNLEENKNSSVEKTRLGLWLWEKNNIQVFLEKRTKEIDLGVQFQNIKSGSNSRSNFNGRKGAPPTTNQPAKVSLFQVCHARLSHRNPQTSFDQLRRNCPRLPNRVPFPPSKSRFLLK